MFAAFPGWYATMFSGLYLAMVLLLISLIIRGVAFEYRGKRDAAQWRRTWDVALTVGSLLAPFVIGVAPRRPAARAADQLQPELHRLILGSVPAVRGVHRGHAGADLPAARRDVPVPENHRRACASGPGGWPGGWRRSPPRRSSASPIWTHVSSTGTFFLRPLELLAILAVLAAVWLVYERRDGFAFAATAVTMASCIVSIFVGLYPNVMVSSTNPAYSLTVHNTASAPYSLTAMTVVVVIFLPIVLAYQCWTYYVFRRRISREQFLPAPPPPRPSVPAQPVPAHEGPSSATSGTPPPAHSRWMRGGRHGRKL